MGRCGREFDVKIWYGTFYPHFSSFTDADRKEIDREYRATSVASPSFEVSRRGDDTDRVRHEGVNPAQKTHTCATSFKRSHDASKRQQVRFGGSNTSRVLTLHQLEQSTNSAQGTFISSFMISPAANIAYPRHKEATSAIQTPHQLELAGNSVRNMNHKLQDTSGRKIGASKIHKGSISGTKRASTSSYSLR